MRKLLAVLAFLALVAARPALALDPENTIYLDLKDGRVVIELRSDLAPGHTARIKELTRQGYYDGLKFHRVIAGFMAQTGDPNGDGTGGSGKKMRAEFSKEKHVRGTVSMARSSDPDSGDSQFFICFTQTGCQTLDGNYTVWGRVTEGMEYVDMIKKGNRMANGKVDEPDRIMKMRVAADVK
ncbi:MAG: peptidylprolyl isomerase [Alphaproteobacteria bacterium]|nr:peptidylprolyl isomerase [Alphaproteobacteria bacterium]